MSIAVNEPVYKTEVIKVSEMPTVKSIKKDSVFLLVLEGLSRKVDFDTLGKSVENRVIEDIKDDFLILDDEVLALSGDVINLKKSTDSKIAELAVDFGDLVTVSCTKLSANLVFLMDEKDKKTVAPIKKSFDDLKLFVDNQHLDRMSLKLTLLDLDLAAQVIKEGTDVTTLRNESKLNIELTALSLTLKINNGLKDAEKSLIETADKLSSACDNTVIKATSPIQAQLNNLVSQVEVLSSESIQADLNLSTGLTEAKDQAHEELIAKVNPIEALQQTHDVNIIDLSNSLSVLEYAVDLTVTHIDTLDAKLYGLEADSQDGDINQLSAELEDVKNTTSELEKRISFANVTRGTSEVKDHSYVRVNIYRKGFEPIAVTTVDILDENDVKAEGFYALNRFICSNEEACIEVVNESGTDLNIKVRARVVYVKK